MAINPDGSKTCSRCKISKPVSEFYVHRRKHGDGFAARCMACAKAAAIEWQKSHPERKAASDAKQRKKQQARAQVDLAFRERRAETVRNWSRANVAKVREQQLAYKKRNPERARQQNQCHNNKARALRLGLMSDFVWDDWKAVLAAFDHTCVFCGVTGALLDIEHLEPMSRGGHNVMGNVVPACRPCNAQKSHRSLAEFCELRRLDEQALRERIRLGLTNASLHYEPREA